MRTKKIIRGKRMRIAMLGQKQIPSRQGGVEIVVENLAVRMAARGNKVVVYNRYNPNFKVIKKYKNVKIKTVPTINKKGIAAISSAFFASLFVAFNRYDIVHIHAEGPAMFCWLPKLLGKKVVVTVHGLNWQTGKWKKNLGAKAIKYGEKVAVKFADEIIVLNKKTQQYFMDNYSRSTLFIPNGVNNPQKRLPDLIKKKWGLEKNNYILFLSRIVAGKGVDKLIRAFKNINCDKKLVIAGGPSDSREYFDEVKKLANNNQKIIFTGPVKKLILDELYSNAYIYVLPSNSEGMPLTVLEAMSYGNCVLVSDIPECKTVVGDYGMSFKTDDIRDLETKLKYLIENSEIVNKLKRQSANYILKKYNWDRVVNETLDVYSKLI